MTYQIIQLRRGMTATAAAIVLFSTAALAQGVGAPADSSAPVMVTPPPVVMPSDSAPATTTPAPPAATPPVATESSARAVATDPPAMTTAAPEEVAAEPETRPVRHRRHAAPTKALVPPPAPAVTPVITRQDAAPAPAAKPDAPRVAAATPPPAAPSRDETLPVAGVAFLALAGAAVAIARRKRRNEEADIFDAPAPVYARADAFAGSPIADRPVISPPGGFDSSHLGRHTQAAYNGPTPDNPSLSLKKRLKRASFLDRREQMAAPEALRTEAPVAPKAPPPEKLATERPTDHVVTRIKLPTRPSMWTSFQN